MGNVSYGLSQIAYNSYLPLLTEASEEVQDAKSFSPMIEQQLVWSKVENEISLVGVAVGAVFGAACVVVSFGVAFIPGVSATSVFGWSCFIGGVWWLLGYIPGFMWLKERPGPEFPANATPWLGWTNIRCLIKESKHHKYAWRFLLIFFIYSDAFTTINQIGILYAQQELCMSTSELALLAVLVNAFATIGSPPFAMVQRRSGWDNNNMLIFALVLMSVLPVYGVLGYFTPDGAIGLKHVSEMYIFACWYGVSLGALLSYSRTLFIDLIPIGKEGAMFSLWSLSSKGSAWVGPFLVAAMMQVTNNLRSAFAYTLVVAWVPIALLYLFIDNREGLIQSGRLSLSPAVELKRMTLDANLRAVSPEHRSLRSIHTSPINGSVRSITAAPGGRDRHPAAADNVHVGAIERDRELHAGFIERERN